MQSFGNNQLLNFYDRGMKLVQSGFRQEAETQFSKAIELNPNFEEAYNARGITRIYLNNYEEALVDFNTAITLNPQYEAALTNRGAVWAKKKDYEKAKKDFDMALQLNPQSINALLNRGNARAKLNQEYFAALEDYEKVLALDPKHEGAHKNIELTRQLINLTKEKEIPFAELVEFFTPPEPPSTSFWRSCLNLFKK